MTIPTPPFSPASLTAHKLAPQGKKKKKKNRSSFDFSPACLFAAKLCGRPSFSHIRWADYVCERIPLPRKTVFPSFCVRKKRSRSPCLQISHSSLSLPFASAVPIWIDVSSSFCRGPPRQESQKPFGRRRRRRRRTGMH